MKPVKYTYEFMRFYLSSNYKNHDKLKFTEDDKELSIQQENIFIAVR